MKTATNTDNWALVEADAKLHLPESVVELIEKARQDANPESYLISILHMVQEHFGYLATDKLDAVAQLLQVPAAKVSGVATFYHFFRLAPSGKHTINVCLGTACYVKGANDVAERLKEELGVELGETGKDGMFTLQATRCLGTCGLAPVVMIDDTIYGQVLPDQIPALLEKYRAKSRK